MFRSYLKNVYLQWRDIHEDEMAAYEYKIRLIDHKLGYLCDQSFRPLTITQRLRYNNPIQFIQNKIQTIRDQSCLISEKLRLYNMMTENDVQDVILIQNFILENLPIVQRYCLK